MIFSLLESIAVFAAIAYLLLAARENLWCWYFAFLSSTLYTLIFWDVSLLMDSLLNVFYVVMAVVGWWQWRSPSGRAEDVLLITRLSLAQHLGIAAILLVLTAGNGWYMANHTSAVWPYMDSFTTWASVINTVLVVRKVLENWLYWLLIDGISIYLYIDRELYLTAALFLAYVIIVVFGFLTWRRRYLAQVA